MFLTEETGSDAATGVQRSSGTTWRVPDAGTRRRKVVAVGRAGDLPRALAHPAVADGSFHVVQSIGVEAGTGNEEADFLGLAALLRDRGADTVLLAGQIGATTMRRVTDLALLHHARVLADRPTETLAGHAPQVIWAGDSPLVRLTSPRSELRLMAKRAIDIVGAVAGLLVAAVPLMLLALAIALESRGPVIFAQERVGRRGQRFRCLKLRTMRQDAEDVLRTDPELYAEYLANHFKIPEDRDPRTTRLGRLLRRTSLDELPQLWNVLRGEMSLVGPRPVVPDELSHYGDRADLLLSVRPGLTGAWAVNGRHQVGYPRRCELELDYVRRLSLRTDLQVMVRTLGSLLA
jgi:exopolysaccharide production protein ExoY